MARTTSGCSTFATADHNGNSVGTPRRVSSVPTAPESRSFSFPPSRPWNAANRPTERTSPSSPVGVLRGCRPVVIVRQHRTSLLPLARLQSPYPLPPSSLQEVPPMHSRLSALVAPLLLAG